MKKKYRVTTRGKIVFPLIALLIIYGLYSMISTPAIESDVPLVAVEASIQETETMESTTDSELSETETVINAEESNSESNSTSGTMIEVADSTNIENCSTNELKDDKEALELRLKEAAGFTIYYEANAYYVPEGDLALLAEFASVAIKFPNEQIVIEGNTNTSVGHGNDLDTENVERLGYTRGLVIKNYLIKRGVDKDRIIIYDNKDSKPLNIDHSAESVALNRRVDVFFSQFSYNEINSK